MSETCPVCGVRDALGRHEGTCSRAVELGLLRLADGEDPIVAIDEVIEEGPVVVPEGDDAPHMREPQPTPDFGRQSRPHFASGGKVVKVSPPELWLSYQGDPFDAVVWGSELDALRHAVANGWRARELQMGVSLKAQVGDDGKGPTDAQQAAGDHAAPEVVGGGQSA